MTISNSLLNLSIEQFINFLKNNNIKRFYFIYDDKNKKILTSNTKLEEISNYLITESIDFDTHEGLFFELDNKFDVIHSAAIHRTNRGQAAGGVRFWQYNNILDFITDGMRLGKGMTYKNALAGLWWGGGKGVIARTNKIDKNDKNVREEIYSNFGTFISSLNGCYVTAEDVGTNVTDMKNVFSKTRFTTCIPEYLGGSGNPSVPTARGVLSGIEAAIDFLGLGTIENKTIAVQGLGNVAIPLITLLFENKASKVIGCDIFEENVNKANKLFNKNNFVGKIVNSNDDSILFENCDVIAPCAIGAILNSDSIPKIKAKIVCGAANNQLADPSSDDLLLFKSGILYVPDFLTNRMGIVNCANEQYGYIDDDPSIYKHYDKNWEYSINSMALKVFKESKNSNKPTGEIALNIAEELSYNDHPIFGHRGKSIINSLAKSNWIKN